MDLSGDKRYEWIDQWGIMERGGGKLTSGVPLRQVGAMNRFSLHLFSLSSLHFSCEPLLSNAAIYRI